MATNRSKPPLNGHTRYKTLLYGSSNKISEDKVDDETESSDEDENEPSPFYEAPANKPVDVWGSRTKVLSVPSTLAKDEEQKTTI